MLHLQTKPYAIAHEAGPIFWTLGLPGRAKATGEQTGGAFSLVEALCPPGYATPLHIHYTEDEAIYVLEGRLTVYCGNEKVNAGSGSYVFQPRGIAHGFRTDGESPARLLCLTLPAGRDQGRPEAGATEREQDLPSAVMLELETLADLAARYKIEVLGPLPDADTE